MLNQKKRLQLISVQYFVDPTGNTNEVNGQVIYYVANDDKQHIKTFKGMGLQKAMSEFDKIWNKEIKPLTWITFLR